MPGEHGLENDVGQYNCFLNVVIQALWHLQSFRKAFKRVSASSSPASSPSGMLGPASEAAATSSSSKQQQNQQRRYNHNHGASTRKYAGACIFCALDEVFVEMEFAEPGVPVDPEVLRRAMAALHAQEMRFQMREIDDAAEAFDALITRLHDVVDMVNAPAPEGGEWVPPVRCACFPHHLFGLETAQEALCDGCRSVRVSALISGGAKVKDVPRRYSEQFLMYTYAAVLRGQLRSWEREQFSGPQIVVPNKSPTRPGLDFFMRRAANADEGDRRPCSGEHVGKSVGDAVTTCNRPTRVRHILRRLPEVLSVAVVWDTADATATEIENLLDAVSLQVDARKMFDGVDEDAVLNQPVGDSNSAPRSKKLAASSTIYSLRGMICYYGQHYVGFFWSADEMQWLSFDDKIVRTPGLPRQRFSADVSDLPRHSSFLGVRQQCIAGRLQPNVLFYEREAIAEDNVSAAASPTRDIDSNSNDDLPLASSDVSTYHGIVVSRMDDVAAREEAAKLHAEDAVAHSVHIPISASGTALLRNNSGVDASGFILMEKPEFSASRASTTVDIPVYRTNWFYRPDDRILRFSERHFQRLRPDDAAAVAPSPSTVTPIADEYRTFHYEDVNDVVVAEKGEDQCTCQIRFRPGTPHASDPQYITTRSTDDLHLLLMELQGRCSRVGNHLELPSSWTERSSSSISSTSSSRP